jgi:drug/metabolite transporter (DMT)-like permease
LSTEAVTERTSSTALVAELALVGVAAVWGLTFVMVQDAIERMPPMTFLGFRFVAAALIVVALFHRKVRHLSRAGWKAGLVMGVFLTAGYIAQTLGLERTSASNAGFITGLFVVLTPVFGAIFLRHPVGRAAWVAALISAFGLFLLSNSGGAGEGRLGGDALVFLCACSFAFHILVTAKAVEHHDVTALLAVQLGLCGVFCLAVAIAMGDLEAPSSAVEWNALLLTAIVASAIGFFVQTYAQQHASPSRTALILASEPAFAGLFAFVLAGESRSLSGWVGAGLIVAAIVGVELLPYLRPPAAAKEDVPSPPLPEA